MLAILLLAGCDGFGSTPVVGVSGGSVGCASPGDALGENWAERLEPSGCNWYVQAIDDTWAVRLTFDIPEFVTASEGEAVSVGYTLPHDDVRFEVDGGCAMDVDECGAVDFTVAETYTPTAGTVDVSVVPDGEEGDATLVFSGVELVSDVGNTTSLDGYTVEVRLGDGG